jgi:hypothetical protein
MTGLTVAPSVHRRWTNLLLRTAIVGMTLATAAIHWSLGGLLFTLNAIGYATFALAMALPGPFRRMRPLVRFGLIGFTGATIVGWYLFGARFDLAYVDKAIEIVLVALATVDLWRSDGGPIALARRGAAFLTSLGVGPR